MPQRAADWFRQAEADLRHARFARDGGHYEWAAFAAHQATEQAIKAVFQHRHQDAWGHTLTLLLGHLGDVPPGLRDRAKELDKHNIPARYPNGFEQGAPVDFYTRAEADRAIGHADEIIEFCRNQIG